MAGLVLRNVSITAETSPPLVHSHPLAKSMDYMQEDLENMSKEYRFWVTERRVAQDRLGDEQVCAFVMYRMYSQHERGIL